MEIVGAGDARCVRASYAVPCIYLSAVIGHTPRTGKTSGFSLAPAAAAAMDWRGRIESSTYMECGKRGRGTPAVGNGEVQIQPPAVVASSLTLGRDWNR